MILLDTHAWLWLAAEPDRLSTRARRAVRRASALGVSVMSCWEAAMLAHRGRVSEAARQIDWQEKALCLEGIELLEVTPSVAVRAAGLQASRDGDPIDWILVATAQERQVALVSKDERLASAGLVEVIW